jgi:beta-galactosidase/beta-glucuronidase
MPTIRGRNTGIWGEVRLTQSGAVTIENPLVATTLPLPDTSSADVKIAAMVRNSDAIAVSGTLRAQFGDVTVEQPVTLDANASKQVEFAPTAFAALHMANPKLWWPNGYGDPNLYAVKLTFVANGNVSDTKAFSAGIREFTYSDDGSQLKIWINGRRFIED